MVQENRHHKSMNVKIGDKVEVLSPAAPNERFGIVNAGPYNDKGKISWCIRFEKKQPPNGFVCLAPDEFKLLDKS